MSKLNINFNDYKSSGVYFLEVDNSVIDSVVSTSGRLAVGFSKNGPFNTPVYIDNTADLSEVYGDIDTKLERKGVFFNRAAQTLIKNSPSYLLNLMPFSKVTRLNELTRMEEKVWADYDKVDYLPISTKVTKDNGTIAKVGEPGKSNLSVGYPELYDKSRFWKASTDNLNTIVASVSGINNLLNIANVGTRDFTVIVRKAEDLKGFNKTVSEWYGTEANIPYAWMRPSDYISDYFVEVIVIDGKWNDPKLALDPYWSKYFDSAKTDGCFQLAGRLGTKSAQFGTPNSVFRRDKLSKFLKEESVTVIGDYVGCILPDFFDGTGALQSIEPIVNQYTTRTGVMLSVDASALENFDKSDIDFVGHTVGEDEGSYVCRMMSYDFSYDASSLQYSIDSSASIDFVEVDENKIYFKQGFLDIDVSTGSYLHEDAVKLFNALKVGSMVSMGIDASSNEEVALTRITKKQIFPDDVSAETYPNKAVFTTINKIEGDVRTRVRIIPSISEMYSTLTPFVLKGLDMDEKVKALFDVQTWSDSDGYMYYGEDAAIAQIYNVLNDKGIRRSLLNDDIIDFRYVIDTMGHGLGTECGSKKFLSKLAYDKKHCLAIINAPSMTEFGTTNLAAFYDEDDTYKTLDTKYIPEGGNDSLIKTEEFSLPSEEYGSKNCGVFAPYLQYRTSGRTILVPPAADVANAYMKKFDGADPYITVANRNGILSNSQIQGIEYQFDRYDQDYLEPFGINPILYKNGEALIYGDRTAYQDVLSDYNYLHVREILNTIEIECKAVLDGYVFRYNNAATRSEIVNRIDPILKGMKDAGALYKYELQMDENNNTNEVINRSFAIIDIGVWITKNMEKVIARITVNKLDE